MGHLRYNFINENPISPIYFIVLESFKNHTKLF